jgi:hypothetical protein
MWVGHIERILNASTAHTFLVRKPEEKHIWKI